MSSLALFQTVKVRYSEQGLFYSAGYNRRSLAALHSQIQCRWNDVRMESNRGRHFSALGGRLPSCRKNGGSALWLEAASQADAFAVCSQVPRYLSRGHTMNLDPYRLRNCSADICSLWWSRPRIQCSWSPHSFHVIRGFYQFYFICIDYVSS